MAGAWRGSSRERVADIVGVAELSQAMKRKRVRWAASVYEQGVRELWDIAKEILKEHLEEEYILRWVKGKGATIQELETLESAESAVEGTCTDGSRLERRTPGATIARADYIRKKGSFPLVPREAN